MSENSDLSETHKNTTKKGYFVAFVLIKIEGDLEEVLKSLKKIDGVKEAYSLFGEYDAIVKLEVESADEVEAIANKILDSIGPVKVVLTLRTYAPPPFIYGDIESRLKLNVGETGVVNPKYGGYEIQVLNEFMFPWLAVFKVLLETNMEIWVSWKDKRIVITSKPPSV